MKPSIPPASLVAMISLLGCDELTSVVQLVQGNVTPQVVAYGPTIAVEGQRVFLGGELTGNIRQPSDPLASYSWTQVDGPTVALDGADTLEAASFLAPSVDADATVSFRLSADTAQGTIVSDVITIAIRDTASVGHPPVADAGTSQMVTPGSMVTLDGSRSSDADGEVLSYLWEQMEGPTVDILDGPESAMQFLAPEVKANTRLKFILTVTDSEGLSDRGEVVVIVVAKRTAS